MSKKKDKKKAVKVTVETDLTLSKKERKKLEERERALEQKLAEKKSSKKAKGEKAPKSKPLSKEQRDAAAPKKTEDPKLAAALHDGGEEPAAEHTPAEIIAAADKVLADANASEGARKSATVAKKKALDSMTDDDLAERVKSKRAERERLDEVAKTVDRDDAAAVKAHNEAVAAVGGGHFITSTDEIDAEAARLAAGNDDRVEQTKLRKARKGIADEPAPQVAEAVETDKGTVYAVGEGVTIIDTDQPDGTTTHEFAKPSEAPVTTLETNGNGQYKIKRKSDGKVVGFTRATTYIANLEDGSGLTKWKLRLLAEGIAVNDTDPERSDLFVAQVVDLAHRRDVAISKARKADKKGKLAVGELGLTIESAWRDYKKAVDTLVEAALDIAGVKEKANKGTDIHALCELYVREGIDAVGDLLTEGKISPADLADVEAFAKATTDAGIRFIPELVEQVVANDDLKVAGRMDYGVLYKFPGAARAVRCVLDLKTGRIDLGAGKIAQQLEVYSSSEGYDLNTHERTDMKLSRTKALVVNLPVGTAKATIHVVDLTLGRRGNALSGQVRAWRNEGKRAIDTSVDLAEKVSE